MNGLYVRWNSGDTKCFEDSKTLSIQFLTILLHHTDVQHGIILLYGPIKKSDGADDLTYFIARKVCSINFEPPDNDLCSACHIYPLSRRVWNFSVLFILNRFTWD